MVEKATVSEVAVAAVTVPIAPSLKMTVLLPGVESKPKPLMVIEAALAARLVALLVTTGRDRGHLHCRATALAVGSDRGGQNAHRSWFRGERHGERSRATPTMTVPTAPSLKVTVL